MYKEYLLFLIWVAPMIATSFGLSKSLPSHSNFFCIIVLLYLLTVIVYCTVQ